MYTTNEARGLVEALQGLGEWAAGRRKRVPDSETYERGLYDGYQAAFKLALTQVTNRLQDIEIEARLIPDVEEDATVWLRKQMSDYSPMAGDYRDFPSDTAA